MAGVSVAPVRNRHEDRPTVEGAEASGTPLLTGTTRTTRRQGTTQEQHNLPPTHNVDAEESHPKRVEPKGKHRTKWPDEINQYIIRCFLLITEIDTKTHRYHEQLHAMVTEKFPEIRHKTPQNIADQRRALMMNNRIPPEIYNRILEEVQRELNWEQDEIENQEQQTTEKDGNIDKTLEDLFDKYCCMYNGTDPMCRPTIPRVTVNKTIATNTEAINKIIKTKITSEITITELHTMVYAGAVTVCEHNKYKITQSQQKRTPQQDPSLNGKYV